MSILFLILTPPPLLLGACLGGVVCAGGECARPGGKKAGHYRVPDPEDRTHAATTPLRAAMQVRGKGEREGGKGGGGGLGLIVLGCGLLRFVLSRLVSCVFVVCLMCCPSLNPGVERLSFSVVWRMNEDGTMVRHITQTSTLPCRHTELDTETHDSTLRHCTEY